MAAPRATRGQRHVARPARHAVSRMKPANLSAAIRQGEPAATVCFEPCQVASAAATSPGV